MPRLTRRQWLRLMTALGAVVVLLFANDLGGWGVLPQVATELAAWGLVLSVTVLYVTRPGSAAVAGFSDEVRPGFERTFQRRRWTTAAVMSVGLLLWANAKFEWGFVGSAAGVAAALGMTAATTVFFAVAPSPAEMRAYKAAQRRGPDAGAGPA